MARRSNRRDVDGWLIIDKPAGMTSTSVVNKAKWLFHANKAGHAGTLDPDATGLLAVAFGEATKTIPYIMDGLKTYTFVVTLGASTTTDDAEGEIMQTNELRPDNDTIIAALPQFVGHIEQTPPLFSAVKINGERAYVAARRGDTVELASRALYVDALNFKQRLSRDEIELELRCGKGGYVRSIARDLGQSLGSLGHVKWLRRWDTGPFDLSQSTTLENIETLDGYEIRDAELLPIEAGLDALMAIEISQQDADDLQFGRDIAVSVAPDDPTTPVWVSLNGRAQAIGTVNAGSFHPTRVILQR